MFQEKHLKVNGLRTHFFDQGKGLVVLLIHGLGGAAVNWARNIGPLSEKYRVVVPDLPSFGQSEMPDISGEDISYGYFSSFLKAFLQKLEIKEAVLVGSSMGGGIALDFKFKFPQLVDKLVVVSGSGLGEKISFYKTIHQPIVQQIWIHTFSNKTIMRQVSRLVVHDPGSINEATIAAYVNWLKNPKVRKVIAQLGPRAVDFNGQKWVFIDRLKEIDCPTLIVWGRNDRVLPLKQGLKANELIKKSRLAVFDKCGHIPYLEKPDKFNQTLLEFLERDGKLRRS